MAKLQNIRQLGGGLFKNFVRSFSETLCTIGPSGTPYPSFGHRSLVSLIQESVKPAQYRIQSEVISNFRCAVQRPVHQSGPGTISNLIKARIDVPINHEAKTFMSERKVCYVSAANQLRAGYINKKSISYLQFPGRGRGSWGGGQHWDGTTVLYGLIAANVAGWFLWRVERNFMNRHFVCSWPAIRQGRIYTIITCAFSHTDGMHLFSNMIGLYFFGGAIAPVLGGRRLLLLYLAGAVASSLAFLAGDSYRLRGVNRWYGGNQSVIGASGAVNAISIFSVCLSPYSTVLIYGILPVPAWAWGSALVWERLLRLFGGQYSWKQPTNCICWPPGGSPAGGHGLPGVPQGPPAAMVAWRRAHLERLLHYVAASVRQRVASRAVLDACVTVLWGFLGGWARA
eukprot:jgi/Botrbrau1/5404/Bobra.182_1s0008.1